MNQPEQLKKYQRLIDEEIAVYSKQLTGEIERTYGPYSRISTEAFTAILARGGKRLRGALVLSAYEMLGGNDQALAVKIARIAEMIHAYLLMTDDIADRSDIRRGGPSAHKQMSSYHKAHDLKGDTEHFGNSIAMMSALANLHLAERDLDELEIPAKRKLKVLKSLHANLVHTLHGQVQDIFIEAVMAPTEADALQVIKLKTAYYTLVNPLEIGAHLAGASSRDIRVLQRYGLEAGIAFQLADDILGLFAEAEQSGKSPLDDMREGKATLLVIRALKTGTTAQNKYLNQALGNPDLTMAELQKCRQIIVDTGSLAYTKKAIRDHTQRAYQELDRAPATWRSEQVAFLQVLTGYVADRQA